MIGFEATRKLISEGNLYLYDIDTVALKICKTIIAVKYGIDIADSIHGICCDFLDKTIVLPSNCKVICNPPYAQIERIQDYWDHTKVLNDTKEFYSAFMEKIISQAKSTVIITPFSFISGVKFESLRDKMCALGNGFIVSFDNVPGNIFCGRKQGIFNTNTANSVRAAITVQNRNSVNKGFKISPLIRFKSAERKRLLNIDILEQLLPDNYQIISETNTMFMKIDKELIDIYNDWINKSMFKMKDFIKKDGAKFLIDMPNTCRYFTVASSKKLSRTGSITMHIDSYDVFNFLYCFINSSFTYWWWRIFDGGITYPVGLLNNMPVPYNLLSDPDKTFFAKMAKELIGQEGKYAVEKMNAGVAQKSIKFPGEYRRRINERILAVLGHSPEKDPFDRVHANGFFRSC